MRFLRTALAGAILFALASCSPAPANPALWHLSDSDSDIWLLGTVHVLPPGLNWRSQRIDDAFAAAETLYLETPIDEPAAANIQSIVAKRGFNPPGVTLSSLMNTADRARFEKICRRLKIAPAQLEPARPWLAAVQLSIADVIARGQATKSGVDNVLDRDARAQGKKRGYFETAEEQISFFADLSRPVEVQFLSSTLQEIEQDSDSVDALDRAWAKGDTTAIDRDVNKMVRDAGPEIYAALIRDRNARWADEIDKMMHGSGKIFIAVGAAHMVGKDGVPALLRKKGYKVEGP